MDDIVNIMKTYGEVVAKLTMAEERLKTLTAEKENLESQMADMAWRYKALETDNANLMKWCSDLRESVLQFCAAHQMQMKLPPQPALSITNNFSGNVGQVIGNVNDINMH